MKHLYCLILWISFVSNTDCFVSNCRSKFGIFKQGDFYFHACAWCYYFLFPNGNLKPHTNNRDLVSKANGSSYNNGENIVPDIDNSTAVEIICSTLTTDECNRWISCCSAGRKCCKHQLSSRADDVNETCASTWDGYACWDSGTPGRTSTVPCPDFLQYSVPTRSALKSCQLDGTWLKKGPHDWTDYTPCLNYQELKISIYISLGCQIASLLCLVPSVIIFVRYKSLIHQHRIRLHVNFFISLILSGVFTILWNTVVTYDRITNSKVSETMLYKNSAECKVLSYLKLYFTSTNYMWMFCEGLYLHRLTVNAFSPPKRLLPFYVLGWGSPFIFTTAYMVVRITQADESCWAKSIGEKQWIIYTPNLFCLAANIYFLCSILRILLTQLQVHPNEPSNFRKALKATFILIPLFGVQIFVLIYRLPADSAGFYNYERFSEFVTNSQGMFVAVIFCLCNGEVISILRYTHRRRRETRDLLGSKKPNSATSLNMNTITSRYNTLDRTSPNKYITLNGTNEATAV
ncbi:calcitonin gene-related peptide type 1 receptor-like [Mercenaria mercenaria]|uniref:calcitonin gene-related peptide type 1 receptor-like n=1 Tax=Mercenaria mercenaria TaxID=6596 RepID=UPI00234EA86C|nr:calcitonin gene-related peptide type 1 receptor-like [Mercenaria mercenaria]